MPVSDFSFLGSLVAGHDDIDTDWTLDDLNMMPRTVNVQSFSNGYNKFVMVWVPERESFMARVRKTPRMVSSVEQTLGAVDDSRIWTPSTEGERHE